MPLVKLLYSLLHSDSVLDRRPVPEFSLLYSPMPEAGGRKVGWWWWRGRAAAAARGASRRVGERGRPARTRRAGSTFINS